MFPMRNIIVPICLAVVAAPALAQDAPVDYSQLEDRELAKQSRIILRDDESSNCNEIVPLVEEMRRRAVDKAPLTGLWHRSKMQCAIDQKNWVEAHQNLLSLEDLGEEYRPLFSLTVARLAEDGPDALKRLADILIEGDQELIEEVSPEAFFAVVRLLRQAGLHKEYEQLADRVASQRDLALFDKSVRNALASGALAIAAAQADTEKAARLALAIDDPRSFIDKLARVEYESIWEVLEERVGESFRLVTASHLENRRANYRNDPNKDANLNQLSHALYFDGEFQEVIALTDTLAARDDLAETMTEDEGWALNLRGYAFDALGRRDEADAVFEGYTLLSPHADRWNINFTINRASRLVGQGRWEEGLAAASLAQQFSGSPYARMLIAQVNICALHALGRVEEIAPHLAVSEGSAGDFPQLHADTLLCVGKGNEAAALLLAGLNSKTQRDMIIKELQPLEFDLFYTRSILPKSRDLLDSHAELRQEFLKHARLIPERLYPRASLMRAPVELMTASNAN